jgi:hypothetical protein
MSEIKSTLDLVMERTKDMVMSKEERVKRKAEEREAKARGWALGIKEHRLKIEEVAAELEKETDDSEREALAGVLAQELIDAIGLEDDNQSILEALESLFGRDGRWAADKARETIHDFLRQLEQIEDRTQDRVIEELNARGVTGSALQAKLGSADDAEKDHLENRFAEEKAKIKTRLASED